MTILYPNNPHLTPTQIERFWAHVDRSAGPAACWPWRGARTQSGHCQTRIGAPAGKKVYAHRWAYVLSHGAIPEGLEVCHNCPSGDNPACCNPAHLWAGTQAENIRDMHAKGRAAKSTGDTHWTRTHPEAVLRGEEHGRAKLIEQDVREIRRRYAAGGVSQPQLAREYGVNHTMIGFVVRRKNWTHVT